MAIKTYRPTTQTLRYRTTLVNDDITSTQPHKPLLEPKPRTGGRRNSGQTTMRFIGGCHKRKLRRRGRFAGYRGDWKKAYVRLKAGEKMPEYAEI